MSSNFTTRSNEAKVFEVYEISNTDTKCPMCEKTFSSNFNLKRHLSGPKSACGHLMRSERMKVVAEEAQEGLNNLPQHKVPDQCPICEQFFSGGKHGVLAHLRAPTRPCAKVLKEKEEHGEMSDFPDKRYYYDRLNINMYVPIPNDKCGDCPICKKEFKYVLQHLKDSTCGIIVKNRAKNGWTDEIDNKEYYYEHLDIKEVEPTAN